MTYRAVALLALPLLAVACSPAAPVTRQPGRWSEKVEIVKLEGKGTTPAMKAQMQAMFDATADTSMCLTPAAAAREAQASAIAQMVTQIKSCTFDRKDVRGGTIDIQAVCKQGVRSVKITVIGTREATAQDLTVTAAGIAPAGTTERTMVIRLKSTRNGACKPDDVIPPAAPAAPLPLRAKP